LSAKDLPRIIKEAFHLAGSGRPGPVVVDIPKNVQQEICEVDFNPKLEFNAYKSHFKFTKSEIKKLKKMISSSKRPCIYAGGGIIAAAASEELRKFAESYNIPVVTTLMGVGLFSGR